MEATTLSLRRPSQAARRLAHEPLAARVSSSWRRVLVAGVGDPLHGDRGFGAAVSRRLERRPLPPGVEVVDFAARGLDLVFALQQGYQAALLIDSVARGEAPGTLTVIEPDLGAEDEVVLDPSALDPVEIVRFARLFGAVPRQVLVLVCEPGDLPSLAPGLRAYRPMSRPVAEAVALAVPLVESLIVDLLTAGPAHRVTAHSSD